MYQSKKILALFLGGHLGNIPEKFESHSPKGYSRFSIFSSGGHFVHQSGTVFIILLEGHISNISMKFE